MSKASFLLVILIFAMCGCGKKQASDDAFSIDQVSSDTMATKYGEITTPTHPGTKVIGNDLVDIDLSNIAEGYFFTLYKGNNPKVKLQLLCPNGTTYTYNITKEPACLPLTSGDGNYQLTLYENISEDQYSVAYSETFAVAITNTFGPFLYSNQYVNFTSDCNTVAKAKELCSSSTSDLEKVSTVYHYVIDTIVYDYEEAENVAYNYLPDVDEVLSTKKGICFDYAALMAAMLRSQSIPTKLEVGYAGDAYHAWISVYIEDIGWIDGIIQFDGKNWSLMDPTFAANGKGRKDIEEFIGDGSNYNTLYIY